MVGTIITVVCFGGFWINGYFIGRVHGYKKFEEIERESKIW